MERQNGNRRLVRQRRIRGLKLRYSVCWSSFLIMCLRCDLSREQKAMSLNCPDEFLVFSTFTDGAPRGIDTAVLGRIGHDSPLPDMLDEFVLADHAVRVLCEINEQVEYLRLDVDHPLGTAQFAPGAVKREVAEI